MTREDALAAIGDKRRKLKRAIVPLVILVPILCSLFAFGDVDEFTWEEISESLAINAAYIGIFIALIFAISGFAIFKGLQRARRIEDKLRPVIEAGAQSPGEVIESRVSDYKKGSMPMRALDIVVQAGGARVQARMTEVAGQDMPDLPVGTPVTVWSHGGISVVSGDGAFLSSAA